MSTRTRNLLTCILSLFIINAYGQAELRPVASKIDQKRSAYQALSATALFNLHPNQDVSTFMVDDVVSNATFYNERSTTSRSLLQEQPEMLRLSLPLNGGESMDLLLYRAEIFTDNSKISLSSNPDEDFEYERAVHYWGIVNGDDNSLTAISITRNEIMGFVESNGELYTLGKMENSNITMFYRTSALNIAPGLGCDTDDELLRIGSSRLDDPSTAATGPNNCVKMYVEVDNSIVTGKGSVTAAANYVDGAFGQVAILYANESINFTINEMLLWNTTDPYTGPSTSDYLGQFRSNVGSSYNGDLAHLVGYQGGGGIAYVDVLCNKAWGHGYSDINSSYNSVPTYSWTVEVLTHEIGHNLGSSHTHACVWGPGNNEPLDCCGQNAGYAGSGCGSGYNCTIPNPPSGTIMSYCHLLGGVGIDFNLGFGQEPGDLIRNRVYNANCLTACTSPCDNNGGDNDGDGSCADVDCNDNDDTIYPGAPEICDGKDNDCNGSTDEGLPLNTYYVDNDGDGYGNASNSISVCDASAPTGYTSNNTDCNDNNANEYPGASCSDGNACTTNDVLDSNCNCSGTYVGDSDLDGVCDAEDVCPGGDDNIDLNGNDIPDFCDCYPESAAFPDNPLTHTGSGSNSTTYNFAAGSKHPDFTISGLNSRTSGKPSNRYIERATVTYVDGSGNHTYGTFNGNSVSSVNVSISGIVNSVTVSLTDGYDGNSSTQLSVSFSAIDFCGEGPACPDADLDGVCDADDVCPGFDDNLLGSACSDGNDCTIDDIYTGCNTCAGTPTGDSDGDGVCDALDICPGGDDNIDTDGDGTPDFCDNSNCNEVNNNFSPNPLTHSGNGSSASTVNLGGNTDVSFTISNINAKTNGKESRRYIEEVTVSYINGASQNITYDVYRGDQVSSVNVSITGAVQSVSISLADVYDGSTSSNMSIDMTSVTSCASGSPAPAESVGQFLETDVNVYPNPSSGQLFIRFNEDSDKAVIDIYNMVGKQIGNYIHNGGTTMDLDLRNIDFNNQFVIVKVQVDGKAPQVERILMIKNE